MFERDLVLGPRLAVYGTLPSWHKTSPHRLKKFYMLKILKCLSSRLLGIQPAHPIEFTYLAGTHTLPLTSTYFYPWLLELLETVWDFDMSALIMLGEAGSGKSPLCRSVMMAQARHNQVRFGSRLKPCIRCSPEIDFTCMRVLSSKVLKSLLDVGLYEAMSRARWGAVKWVQNQPRAVADNTFDDEVVLTEPDFVTSVSFNDFMKIIRPAFHPDISKSHMQAVLKRSCIIVNTATHVYYRMAGINEKPAPRIHIEAAEFLTDAGKKLYGALKNGSRILPEDFDAQVRREQAWVGELVDKRVAERRPDHHLRVGVRRGLFGDASASSRRDPIFRQVDRDAVRVKRERAEEVEQVFKKAGTWAAELRASSSIIDLDSPDRKVNERTLQRLVPLPVSVMLSTLRTQARSIPMLPAMLSILRLQGPPFPIPSSPSWVSSWTPWLMRAWTAMTKILSGTATTLSRMNDGISRRSRMFLRALCLEILDSSIVHLGSRRLKQCS